MFELVNELKNGAEELKKLTANPISLTAGCELFIAFVTLFPHQSDVSRGKYISQADAFSYRTTEFF